MQLCNSQPLNRQGVLGQRLHTDDVSGSSHVLSAMQAAGGRRAVRAYFSATWPPCRAPASSHG